jgi:hypothetical protein
MKPQIAMQWTASAMLALTLLTACQDNAMPTGVDASADRLSSNSAKVYEQVEFLGNPLVSEVTIVKARHDAYNRTMPYAPGSFIAETKSFITTIGGRSQARADLLASVLYSTSDMLIVDTRNPPATAGWLSWVPQVNAVYGAVSGDGRAAGPGWGGRRLSDDVVDVGLTAIFSSFLSDVLGDAASASCAPFALPLCTDNVGANDKSFSNTFPYLAPPTL